MLVSLLFLNLETDVNIKTRVKKPELIDRLTATVTRLKFVVQLELGYASVTSSLEPPHTYVPWVVVDGQPLYDVSPLYLNSLCIIYCMLDPTRFCTTLLPTLG